MTINDFSIENMRTELATAKNKICKDAKTIQTLRDEIESLRLTLKASGVAPMLLDQGK